MQYTMERKCALLSFIFSDVLVFHVTTTQYGHLIRFILAIFELAIGFLQKEAKWRYVIVPFCPSLCSCNFN